MYGNPGSIYTYAPAEVYAITESWEPTFTVVVQSLTHIRLFATPWTVAPQAPLSKGFAMQEYWSGLQIPSPGDLPGPVIEPMSSALQADFLLTEPLGKPNQHL